MSKRMEETKDTGNAIKNKSDPVWETEVQSPYLKWVSSEGIPVVGGYAVADLLSMPLAPWDRLGGKGAYVQLIGAQQLAGAYVVEIPPGGALNREKHLYEEEILVLSGRGTAHFWSGSGVERQLPWKKGTLFAPPLNGWHQLVNEDLSSPARLFVVTNAPLLFNLLRSPEAIFEAPYGFPDRFDGSQDFSRQTGTFAASLRLWEGNFIKDVMFMEAALDLEAGKGFPHVHFRLAENTMGGHIGVLEVGCYKKAHWHGPGAHIVILTGTGYTLMWPPGGKWLRIDWKPGSLLVPPGHWYHQHFNTSLETSRHIALRVGSRRFGGIHHLFRIPGSPGENRFFVHANQIEYAHEDPEIRRMYEAELVKVGIPLRLPGAS